MTAERLLELCKSIETPERFREVLNSLMYSCIMVEVEFERRFPAEAASYQREVNAATDEPEPSPITSLPLY